MTCVVDMDMVRPWKDPWGLSTSGQPWEAWAILTDICGPPRAVGPPRVSMLAVYVTATVVVTVAAGTRCTW